jgi:hypothetical protein
MDDEEDFFQEAEDDSKTVEFIKNYLPQDLKGKFSDEDLFYILDVIADYYMTSGVLEKQPDQEGFVDIDQDEIANYIIKVAKKDKMGNLNYNDILFIVEGEMEYAIQSGEVE